MYMSLELILLLHNSLVQQVQNGTLAMPQHYRLEPALATNNWASQEL